MQPIVIPLNISKQWLSFFIGIFSSSLLIILYLPLLLWIKIFLLSITICYAGIIFYHQYRWQFLFYDHAGWHIQKSGKREDVQLCGESTLTTWVSILRFKSPNHYLKSSYVLFKDSISSAHYRQLLLIAKGFGASGHLKHP